MMLVDSLLIGKQIAIQFLNGEWINSGGDGGHEGIIFRIEACK